MENQNLDLPPGIRRGRKLTLVSERTAAPQKPDAAAGAAALAAKEADLQAALATVKAAFAILGSRALVIVTACTCAAAWGYVLIAQPAFGPLSAALATAMLFWPALWADLRR